MTTCSMARSSYSRHRPATPSVGSHTNLHSSVDFLCALTQLKLAKDHNGNDTKDLRSINGIRTNQQNANAKGFNCPTFNPEALATPKPTGTARSSVRSTPAYALNHEDQATKRNYQRTTTKPPTPEHEEEVEGLAVVNS